MTDVFISYSRKDIAFAKKLYTGLDQAGLEIWIDWEDIPPSTDWMDEIQEAIEGTDAFIFIISPQSISSEISSREMTFAAENNKRLIPIVIDDIDPGDVPPFVAALNWIFFRKEDDFNSSLQLLLEAIQTDQNWVKSHTRYQTRALEWDRSNRITALQLHGEDIVEAEHWLINAEGKDPPPTELQRTYILASRQSRTRNQRLIFGGLAGVLILSLGFTAMAFLQRSVTVEQSNLQATAEALAVAEAAVRATAESIAVQERDARSAAVDEAEIQRNIALSQFLAVESLNLSATQLDLKLILSAAAMRFYPSVEAKSSLLDAIDTEDYFQSFIFQDAEFIVTSASLNPDGTLLAVGSNDGEIHLLNTATGEDLGISSALQRNSAVSSLVFSANGEKLVSTHESGQSWLYDLSNNLPQGKDLSIFPSWVDFRAINADGGEVAGLSSSGKIAIWDVETGEIQIQLSGSNAGDHPLIFSPQGQYLATIERKESVRFWYRSTGKTWDTKLNLPEKALESLDLPQLNSQYNLVFHPQAEGILIGVGHNTYYYDFNAERIPSRGPSIMIGFDEDNEPVAFSIIDKSSHQWKLQDEEIIGQEIEVTFGGHPSLQNILGVFWSPISGESFYIFPGDNGGTVIARYSFFAWGDIEFNIIDSLDYRAIAHVPGADGNLMIATGCGDRKGSQECERGVVQFWGGEDWDPIGEPIPAHLDWISTIAISSDGEYFATASQDNTVQLWDLNKKKPVGEPITVDFIGIDAQLQFQPEGKLLVLYDGWDRIYFIDPGTGTIIGEPFQNNSSDEEEALRHFAFSPDGNQIAFVRISKIVSAEISIDYGVNEYFSEYLKYILSPEGEYWVVNHDQAILEMWELEDISTPDMLFRVPIRESELGKLNLEGSVPAKVFYPIAFHPDGSIVAVGANGSAYLIDVKSKVVLFSPPSSIVLSSETGNIAYSPNGEFLAVADTGGRISLLDGTRGVRIGPTLGGPGSIQDDLVFTPDNESLLVVFHDELIARFNVSVSSWQNLVCRQVNRELSPEEWQIYLPGIDIIVVCPP